MKYSDLFLKYFLALCVPLVALPAILTLASGGGGSSFLMLFYFMPPAWLFGRPHFALYLIGAEPKDSTGYLLTLSFYLVVAALIAGAGVNWKKDRAEMA